MPKLRTTSFGGILPKADPGKLPEGYAQQAQNCDLTDGMLSPLETLGVLHTYTGKHLVCGEAGTTTLATWQAITDGAFDLVWKGCEDESYTTTSITGLDFSGDSTMYEVAETISVELASELAGQDLRCLWKEDHFVFKSQDGQDHVYSLQEASAGTDISGTGYLNGQHYNGGNLVCSTAGSATPATWAAVSDAYFTIVWGTLGDGWHTETVVGPVDFSECASMAGVAEEIRLQTIVDVPDLVQICDWETDHFKFSSEAGSYVRAVNAVPGTTGTDISGTSWMNGQDDVDAKSVPSQSVLPFNFYDGASSEPFDWTWLMWAEFCPVAHSPIQDDSYDRYYHGHPRSLDEWQGPFLSVRTGGAAYEYRLAIPTPDNAPTVANQAKDSVTWTRQWGCFYEEPDGTQVDQDDLTEGVDVIENTPGEEYELDPIPARDTASESALFVLWFDAYDADGNHLGRVYADHSAYGTSSDLFVAGAETTMRQENTTTAVATLSYDTSRASDYEVIRSYLYTYVTSYGEEGAPSAASEVVSCTPAQDVLVSAMDMGDSEHTARTVTAIRIYRTVTTVAGTEYHYVTEIDFKQETLNDSAAVTDEGGGIVGLPCTAHGFSSGDWITIAGTTNYDGNYEVEASSTAGSIHVTATYVAENLSNTDTATLIFLDTLADDDTGEILPSLTWSEPKDGMQNLTNCAGGFLAGSYDNTVYFSEPYYPHAWPTDYAISVEHDIVALAPLDNGIVILTEAGLHFVLGAHPAQMTLVESPVRQVCVSARSVVTVGNSIFYASPDGLVAITGTNASLVSAPWFDRATWQDLDFERLACAAHDSELLISDGTTTYIADVSLNPMLLTTTSQTFDASFSDPLTDTLYMVDGDELKAWRRGDSMRQLSWHSQDYYFARRFSPTSARIVADEYPVAAGDEVQLLLYADGTLAATITITDDRAFRIPRLAPAKQWSAKILAKSAIREFALATSMAELTA